MQNILPLRGRIEVGVYDARVDQNNFLPLYLTLTVMPTKVASSKNPHLFTFYQIGYFSFC